MANPLKGDSNTKGIPGVLGENTAGGSGVHGDSKTGRGVSGRSTDNYGVSGDSTKFPGVRGTSLEARGVEGWSTKNDGVWGISTDASGVHGVTEGRGTGVVGESKDGRGVHGISETFQGVLGESVKNAGIVGESKEFHAIFGISHSSNNGGVIGINDKGGWGVIGRSESNTGVSGESTAGRGIHGISETGEGVHGQTNSLTVAAVVGINHAPDGTGAAIYAEKKGNKGHAGFFVGNVHVTKNLSVDGDIVLNGAADCAEDFDIANAILSEPGTVMVLGEEGALYPSQSAYDKRVVGVVSGAGDYRTGIVLDKQHTCSNRKPIALLGKVFCKVDASSEPVSVGDLLTTSDTPGHAMKAVDPTIAFGAVIGKALRPLKEGQGLIPILVTLQ
jgi:hypothetical protein